MASNDRELINHLGRYIPRINHLIYEWEGPNEINTVLTYKFLEVLKDELLEGFGRMEQSQFNWSEPFDINNVRIK